MAGREQAEVLCAWRYESEYALYDRTPEGIEEVMDPASGYLALMLDGDFVGFCSFGADGQVPGGTYDDTAVDVGSAARHHRIVQSPIAESLREGRLRRRGRVHRPTGRPFKQYRREAPERENLGP